MSTSTRRPIAAWLVVASALLSSAPSLAAEGPTIEHTPLKSFTKGQPVTITAQIRSASAKPVFEPMVFVRQKGLDRFARVAMQPVAGAKHTYAAPLPAALTVADFDYYVEAFDEEGNGPSRTGSFEKPLQVKVLDPLASLPRPPPPPPLEPPPAVGASPATQEPAVASILSPAGELKRNTASSKLKTAGMLGVGLGGALVVGALVSGGLALAAKGEMQTGSDNHDPDRFQAAEAAAKGRAMAADILAGAGLVVGLAGGIVWWTAPSGRGFAASAAPLVGGGALHLAAQF